MRARTRPRRRNRLAATRGRVVELLALLLTLCLPTASRTAEQTEDPGDLIRRVVANELKADEQKPAYSYQVRRETLRGSRVSRRVVTRDGTVGLVVAVDDKPLSDSQMADQYRALERAITDPDWRRRLVRSQQDELIHRQHVLEAMPDGFLYQNDGKEENGLLRLAFKPNPGFQPKTREAQVFYGMEGRVWVDPQKERIARIEATLVRDVQFGWGLFGHLDRGGTVEVRQTRLDDGDWQPGSLSVKLTGKILLLKDLKVDQKAEFSDYQPAPRDLSLADGIELLRHKAGATAPGK